MIQARRSLRRPLRLESLEYRRVLAAPDVTSVVVSPNPAQLGDVLTATATVVDVDDDVTEVKFYVDDGDTILDPLVDQLIGTDTVEADGWQLVFPTQGPYRILPLGDSITQADSQHLSYRYPLFQHLVDAGYDYDLVGTQSGNHQGDPTWPDYLGQSFDRDHEGHWGWTADEILNDLPSWLGSYTPDIVLMHLGTNDMLDDQGAASTILEIEQIIDVLRQDNPQVVVLVAQLIPTFPSDPRIDAFNAALPAAVDSWNTAASPVIMVDQNSGFDAQTQTYDGIHPNASGEQQMADVWQQAIEAARPVADPSSIFTEGQKTVFAVATDATSAQSTPTSTTVDIVQPGPGPDYFAESETTTFGTVTGNLTLTRDSDDVYEQIEEEFTGGSTHLLRHLWEFDIPAGDTATFQLEAYHDSPNDFFYVTFSEDGNNWQTMMTVTKQADDDQLQTWQLPEGASGTVFVRVVDANPSNDSSNDSFFVDFMSIHVEGDPQPNLPTVSIAAAASAAEAGPVTGQFLVTRTGDLSSPLDVNYQVAGNATPGGQPGEDYVALSGMVTIPALSAQATIDVVPIDDLDAEGDENVIVTITADPTYDVAGSGQAIVTIQDDEQSGTGFFFPISESTSSGSAGGLGNVFDSDDTYQTLTESDAPSDLLSHRWTFDIAPGASAVFSMEAYSTSSTEVFWVSFSTDGSSFQNMLTISNTTDTDLPQTYTLPTGISGTVIVSVRDSDGAEGLTDMLLVDRIAIEVEDPGNPALPLVSLAASMPNASEAGAVGQFTVSRIGDLSQAVTVNYQVGGNATPNADYVTLPGSVTIPAFSAQATIDIVPIDDMDAEGNENVILTLSSDPTYNVDGSGQAIVTIQDDEQTSSSVFFPISETTLSGSASGLGNVLASDDTYQTITETTTPGDALSHRWEFDIQPGASATFSLEAYSTSASEVFWVSFSTDGSSFQNMLTMSNTSDTDQPQTYDLPAGINGTVIVAIRDSDGSEGAVDTLFVDRIAIEVEDAGNPALPIVSVVSSVASASEAGAGTAEFTVSRIGDVTNPLTVFYQVAASSTATVGDDYVALSGQVQIPANSASATVDVQVVDDMDPEGNETVVLQLTTDVAYTLGAADNAVVTIIDDDSSSSDAFAVGEQTVTGSLVSGNLADTFASDDVYEVLGETAGPNAQVLHEWEFQVPAGSTATISMEAYTNSTTDIFYINVTDDGSNWRNLLTINKNADDNQAQTREIPFPVSDSVRVRLIDSTRTADAFADSVFVDELKLLIA